LIKKGATPEEYNIFAALKISGLNGQAILDRDENPSSKSTKKDFAS
jgi:hypothetical protein